MKLITEELQQISIRKYYYLKEMLIELSLKWSAGVIWMKQELSHHLRVKLPHLLY